MRLKTAALITFVVIAVGFVGRTVSSLSYLVQHPLPFVLSSAEPVALLFFFWMLYRHAGGEEK